jgi:hypothetical protein
MRIASIVVALAGMLAATPAHAQSRPLTIQHDRLPGMCLTLGGPGGASVNMPCTGAAHQKFALPGPAGGPARVGDSGPIQQGDKCLVPRGTGYYPQVFLETCDGSPEQTWTMNEEHELRTAAGRCLSLMGSVSVNGTTIFAGECPKQGSAHQWRATYVDFTNVIEASLESKVRPGMCIAYDRDLWLRPCTDNYGQVVSFDEKALGQMRMMGSCFSGGFAFGGLSLSSCYDTPAQKWMLLPGDRVANQQVQCIEVVPENGRDVLRTTPCSTGPEQQWIVRKTQSH